MAASISGPQNEREWARRRELQHAVLLYLLEGGPTKWDVLYDHFDQDRTGEIGPALRHLAHWKHISVVGSVATITASGMEQVKSGK